MAGLNTLLAKQLKRQRPKDTDGSGTFDVSLSSDNVLSKIKYVLKTGIDPLDEVLGGLPFGRIVELYGLESCLAGSTFIHYCIYDKNHKIQNSKGGSLHKLWHRFHQVEMNGKGHYQRDATIDGEFYLTSVNEEDAIFRNKIVDVVRTGPKECFEVKTATGFTIRSTGDHKFYTGTDYVRLSDLTAGSQVMIHNNTPFTGRKESGTYAASNLKYYYKGCDKDINGCIYKVEYDHRLAVEAQMNDLTLDQYKELLNSRITKLPGGFKTLPEGSEVHHIDENRRNNSLDNLELIHFSQHGRLHALKNHNKLRFVAVADAIVSITPVGIHDTYDIKCEFPYNNFVADGFVVHNCGKTATCIRSAIKAQVGEIYERSFDETTSKINLVKMDPKKIDIATVFIDNEQSIDEDAKLKIDGIELECLVARCDTVDQLFKISDITITKMAEKQAEENEKAKAEKRDPIIIFTVIIVDTIAGTSSTQEMKQEWNKEDYQRQPKMLRQGFRRMAREINRNNVLMICTNQVSENFSKAKSQVKFSVPQAGDFTTFGGRAIKYYASIRVFMYQIQENYKLSTSKFSQGFLIGFYTVKNRVVKPCRSARMVLLFEGGLSNDYSKFETLCFLGLVSYSKSTKRYAIKFSTAGIETTTFAAVAEKKSTGSRLEEDDDRGGRRSNDPEIENKRAWSQFYVEHQVDCDRLWDVARGLLFSDTIEADVEGADDDDDLDLDDDK